MPKIVVQQLICQASVVAFGEGTHAVPASHLARTVPHRDRKWAGGAQPIRYAGFVRSRSPVVRRARATGDMRPTGRAQHSRVTEARAEGSRTARGRASIRWPGRRGTPGWTTRAGAARACPRRHRTTPEIERGGRRPTRSASPRAVERTRDTDRGSPRRLVPVVGSLDATCAADAAPTAACPKTASSARSRNDRPARSAVVARRTAAHLRVDLPDVDHGARVLGDRGKNRRVVEAPAGCPSPQRNCGAWPPRTTTGEPLKCAVATPDTPLVPLGPAVRTGRRPGPTLGSRLGR